MLRISPAVSAILLAVSALPAPAQERTVTMPLDNATLVQPHNVTVKAVRYGDSDVLEIRQIGEARGFDLDTFAFVPGLDFHDGTIELDVAGIRSRTRRQARAVSSGLPSASIRQVPPLRARDYTSARPTAEPRTRFAATIRPSIFHIRATISIACGGTHRTDTNPIRTSCLANGPICGSRSRARPRNSMSALPRSPCSSCRI